MDLSIRFEPGRGIPREVVEEALCDGLEGAGELAGGSESEIRFTLKKRAPREKVLKVVRLTPCWRRFRS